MNFATDLKIFMANRPRKLTTLRSSRLGYTAGAGNFDRLIIW
jgi:hypothetical protein